MRVYVALRTTRHAHVALFVMLCLREKELVLNFNSTPESDVQKIFCAAENAVSHVYVAQRDEARTRVVNVLSKLRPNSSTPALTSEERKAVKSLRENADIAILPADKGNATVLLDTTAYIDKMESLLKDRTRTQPLRSNKSCRSCLPTFSIPLTGNIRAFIADYCATTDMPWPCMVCQKFTSLAFPCVPSSTYAFPISQAVRLPSPAACSASRHRPYPCPKFV